jgi:hypothetical protein
MTEDEARVLKTLQYMQDKHDVLMVPDSIIMNQPEALSCRENGWVERIGVKPSRYYALTPAGRAALEKYRSEVVDPPAD